MIVAIEKMQSRHKIYKIRWCNDMEIPNPNNIWETFIQIPIVSSETLTEDKYKHIVNGIRFQIQPLINSLRDNNSINWFSFLIHGKNSGVPTREDDNNLYFHLRLSFSKKLDEKDIQDQIPKFCLIPLDNTRIRKTDVIQKGVITGIEKEFLKSKDILFAWKIIGEASEWVLNMIDIYDDDQNIPIHQISQFLHFFRNMLQTTIK